MTTNSPILGFPEVAANQTQKEVTINTGLEALESATQDKHSTDMSAGNVTLNATQWAEAFFYILSGATAAHNCTVPETKRFACFSNTGTGDVTLVCGTSTLVVAAATTTLIYCDGTTISGLLSGGGGGSSDLSVSTQTGSYTLALSDANSVILCNDASAMNITVPPQTSVTWTQGKQITLVQTGAGQVTAVAGAGVTILYPSDLGLKTRHQNSAVTLIRIAADTWVLIGDISA